MNQLKVRLNLKHHYFSFHLFYLKVSLSARPIEIEQWWTFSEGGGGGLNWICSSHPIFLLHVCDLGPRDLTVP